jgi:hypothetical protein
MTANEQMQRIADEVRESWERSLVGKETGAERQRREELTRKWCAPRKERRAASMRGQL